MRDATEAKLEAGTGDTPGNLVPGEKIYFEKSLPQRESCLGSVTD
jgi:hypothetical protein